MYDGKQRLCSSDLLKYSHNYDTTLLLQVSQVVVLVHYLLQLYSAIIVVLSQYIVNSSVIVCGIHCVAYTVVYTHLLVTFMLKFIIPFI